MLDIRLIREQPEEVKKRLQTRGGDESQLIDQLLEIDSERRKGETEKQQLQSDRKRISKEIGKLRSQGEDSSAIETEVREIGDKIAVLNEAIGGFDQRQEDLMLSIPNLPHPECPVGLDETANPEIRTWGEKPSFSFEPVDHVELSQKLGLLDFENAAKIAGSGYVVFTGAGAKLERALIQYLLDLHTGDHDYTEVSPPFLIRRSSMFGTGQLPKFEDDMYGVEDGEVLSCSNGRGSRDQPVSGRGVQSG